MKKQLIYMLLLSCPGLISGQQQQLPEYNKQEISVSTDWMLSGTDAKAGLYQTPEGYLVLSNGLVSRTFTTTPNVATIGLEELGKDISYLRSVRPEATVTIDDMTFDVGGLKGQPVHNYLLKAWIPSLSNDPSAFQCTGYRIEETKERFAWMKKQDWMPKDMPWPAPGKELIFTYQLNDEALRLLAENRTSDACRPVLYTDDFKTLNKSWQLKESNAHSRNSFINEGKVGEIMALANSAVYAEQDVNPETRVLTVKIVPGTDQSASFAPGMALVFGDRIIKANVRGADKKVGFFDGKKEQTNFSYGEAQSVWLRMEITGKGVEASASTDGIQWHPVGKSVISDNAQPLKVRIGKTDGKGESTDAKSLGSEGRSRIESFTQLGALPVQSAGDIIASLAYLKQIKVNVHYELYDNLPVFCKWLTLTNESGKEIVVNSFTSEILALYEPESSVDHRANWMLPNITVETDYNFGGMSDECLYASSIAWKEDPLYATQVNYERTMPCLLEAAPKAGPQQIVSPGQSFDSFRTWELINDSWDRERKSLGYRRMMRAVAPWVTENPILMHVRSSDNESVKKAIDQCAEVGFEMVIMTFWSGFEAEDDSPENLKRMTALADYAASKGIALGGYSLLASRHIDAENDVVLPEGQTPRFGSSPCIESEWGHEYFRKLYQLYDKTGLNVFEHDGSYPGDWCYSEKHPGHKGMADSQWNQFRRVADFYKWCRSKGIYLNIPDVYFLNGSNKTGMGYREANWSLPRAQQEIIERQNIYDGTWNKTPSMGWMFVPLVEYQGGGKEATIEPLNEHLPHYGQRLANLFGAGVQACYRGPQLYDSPDTKALVSYWVDFYKKHREVLDSDIIHIRRPDGTDYDAILHVNPEGNEKGLLMIYNPLTEPIKRNLTVDLYYTGITDKAVCIDSEGNESILPVARDYTITIPVEIPANSQTWFILK